MTPGSEGESAPLEHGLGLVLLQHLGVTLLGDASVCMAWQGPPSGWGVGREPRGRATSRGQVSVLLRLPTPPHPHPAQEHTQGRNHTPQLGAKQESTHWVQAAGRRRQEPSSARWQGVGTKSGRNQVWSAHAEARAASRSVVPGGPWPSPPPWAGFLPRASVSPWLP